RIAEDENVRYIRLQFTDILGTIKNVEIPIKQLGKALDGEIMFDGSSIEGFARVEESDMFLKPDMDTWLIFPWSSDDARIGRLICDIYDIDGKPFSGDPRSHLNRVVAVRAGTAYDAHQLSQEPWPVVLD